MSKRVRFDDDSIIAEKVGKYKEDEATTSQTQTSLPGSRFNENHSIDSDDEEEGIKKEDFEKLTEEDVEGAENEEISGDYVGDGGPIITPFNLREEMEEGDFDTSGHYHFKKDKEISDNWLDNIDWVGIKKGNVRVDDNYESDEDNKEPFNEIQIIEGIVELLKKGETVSKGLRRLGGASDNKNKRKSSKTWQREKMYDMEAEEDDTDIPVSSNSEKDEKKQQFLQLTELADQMAGAGHYDIYSDTFEKLQHKLNSLQVSDEAAKKIPEGADAEDALDIFADSIDTNDLNKPSEKASNHRDTNGDADKSVKWQYKWNDKETELFGPFTSTQMAEWKEQGYFKDGVKVRRTDQPDSAFYNARRIDFDLYE